MIFPGDPRGMCRHQLGLPDVDGVQGIVRIRKHEVDARKKARAASNMDERDSRLQGGSPIRERAGTRTIAGGLD